MYYCSNKKHLDNPNIKRLIPRSRYLYYDEDKQIFTNRSNRKKNITGKEVVIISDGQKINKVLSAISKAQAINYNTAEDYKKVKEWYKYIEPKRLLLEFTGNMINDPNFLRCIKKIFGPGSIVHFSTAARDFSKDIHLYELLEFDSPIRIALTFHPNDTFIISEKMDINEDEYGKEEYDVLVEKGVIANIIRTQEPTSGYIISKEVTEAVNDILLHMPKNYPDTFVLKVASYQNMYEIVELIPLEIYDVVPRKIRSKTFADDYEKAFFKDAEIDIDRRLTKKQLKYHINFTNVVYKAKCKQYFLLTLYLYRCCIM